MADPNLITNIDDLRRVLEVPESQVPTVQTPPDPLLPRAKEAVERFTGPLTDESFLQQEQRPGVPLQMRVEKTKPTEVNPEGLYAEPWTVNPWIRFQTARRQNVTDQQTYLESKFGKDNVRKSEKTDDFIIRVPDPNTGKSKDVLLNERDITLGDIGALVAQAPEIALSLLVSSVGGGIGSAAKIPQWIRPVTEGLGRLVGGAAGYKLGQAAQQTETELEDTGKAKPFDILTQKAKEVPAQTIADAMAAGVFKGFSTLNRLRKGGPGMFQTQVEKEGLPAAERLSIRTGTPKLQYSVGEASGMPLADYLEAYAGSKPQSAAIRDEFITAQKKEVQAIYDAITSKAGTDEQAGQALSDFIEKNQAVKRQAIEKIRGTMSERESQALTAQLGKTAPVQIPFKSSTAGQQFRTQVQDAYKTIKGNVANAYENAYAVPGAMIPSIPTGRIAAEIDAIAGQFAQYNKVEGVQWLNAYKKGLEPKETYRDIVNRRSDLWNKIEESPADRSTKDFLHSQLSSVMTQALDDASKNIMNPKFRGLIQKANELYKKEELPFYQEGIHDILRKAGQRGSPENIELLNRFNQNTDLYRRLREVTGANSPAIQTIKSSVIDGLLTKSGREAIDPTNIDAATFAKNFEAFAANPKTREMFRDIFGKNADSVRRQSRTLAGVQGSIPKEEVERFLASNQGPRSSRLSLLAMKNAQDRLDKVEGGRLLKSPTEFVNPEQVANRFLRFYTESEVKALQTRLQNEAPGIADQLVDKVTEQILGKAGAAEKVTSASLKNVLTEPEMASKYKLILGQRYDDLMDLSKALGPRDRARELAKATGLLVKGESIGEIGSAIEGKGVKHGMSLPMRTVVGIMGIVPGWLGWKLTTKAITSGAFREWASHGYPPGWDKSIQAGLITEPFLMDIASSSGSPEIVKNVAMGLRQWANRAYQPEPKKTEQPPIHDVEELRKFLNQ